MDKLIFDYMNQEKVCSKVKVEYNEKDADISVINLSKDPVDRAFGVTAPSLDELDSFFRSRCFPETRLDKKEILKSLELDFFDAEQIVRKTHGVLVEDTYWVRFEGETLTWNEVKLSNRK